MSDGCRLLLVCEVALGQCKDLYKRDFTLTSAPEGYNSVHGVRHTQNAPSDFEVLLVHKISSLAREHSRASFDSLRSVCLCCRMMSMWCITRTRSG